MPCDTITTVTIKWSTSTDLGLLEAALRAMGVRTHSTQGGVLSFGRGEWFNKATGEMNVATSLDQAALKREYSKQIVMAMAVKNRWQVKTLPNNQFEVIKR